MSAVPISIQQAENDGQVVASSSRPTSSSYQEGNWWRGPRKEPKLYACRYCGKSFASKKYTREHERHVHEDLPRYRCTHCSERFQRKWEMREHELLHAEANTNPEEGNTRVKKQLQCRWCWVGYRNERGVFIHKRIRHNSKIQPSKQFPCPICNKVFKTKYHLKKHERIRHTEGILEPGKDEVEMKPSAEEIDIQLAAELQAAMKIEPETAMCT